MFKVTLRNVQVGTLQYGAVELYVRLVNQRDASVQATSRVDPANIARYDVQPQVSLLSRI